MVDFSIVQGGKNLDPCSEDIPAPDKPIEEWTAEDREEYESFLWDNAEPGTVDYVIKNLAEPAEAIETAERVIGVIQLECEKSAALEGINTDFPFVSAAALLKILRRRVAAEKKDLYE